MVWNHIPVTILLCLSTIIISHSSLRIVFVKTRTSYINTTTSYLDSINSVSFFETRYEMSLKMSKKKTWSHAGSNKNQVQNSFEVERVKKGRFERGRWKTRCEVRIYINVYEGTVPHGGWRARRKREARKIGRNYEHKYVSLVFSPLQVYIALLRVRDSEPGFPYPAAVRIEIYRCEDYRSG